MEYCCAIVAVLIDAVHHAAISADNGLFPTTALIEYVGGEVVWDVLTIRHIKLIAFDKFALIV